MLSLIAGFFWVMLFLVVIMGLAKASNLLDVIRGRADYNVDVVFDTFLVGACIISGVLISYILYLTNTSLLTIQ